MGPNDKQINKILGLCREHTEHVGLDFCAVPDLKAFLEGVLCGEIHYLSEVGTFIISILHVALI